MGVPPMNPSPPPHDPAPPPLPPLKFQISDCFCLPWPLGPLAFPPLPSLLPFGGYWNRARIAPLTSTRAAALIAGSSLHAIVTESTVSSPYPCPFV
jgi:hypothetical protein